MTLDMSCEQDANTEATNWLDANQKALKARTSSRPSDLECLSRELDEYVDEANIAEDKNPYQWWAANHTRFPNVADVARQYLAIPATSVDSERVFSRCGQVCSDRRSSLTPQHIEQLVFLSQNL